MLEPNKAFEVLVLNDELKLVTIDQFPSEEGKPITVENGVSGGY